MPPEQPGPSVVHRLYDAFRSRDAAAMQACYAPDATFRDPVFDLAGADRIGAMWRMLLERGADLVVEVHGIDADDAHGRAHWEARYTFGPSGRPVHNVIEASFRLRDGLIARHVDDFDLWRWSRQALGPLGTLLGWSPLVRRQVRATARRSLARYSGRPEGWLDGIDPDDLAG